MIETAVTGIDIEQLRHRVEQIAKNLQANKHPGQVTLSGLEWFPIPLGEILNKARHATNLMGARAPIGLNYPRWMRPSVRIIGRVVNKLAAHITVNQREVDQNLIECSQGILDGMDSLINQQERWRAESQSVIGDLVKRLDRLETGAQGEKARPGKSENSQ